MDMEICGNLMGQSRDQSPNPPLPSTTTTTNDNNNNSNNNVCWGNHIWELNSCSLDLDWATTSSTSGNSTAEGGLCLQGHPFLQHHHHHPDPHVMCLKLGKRHYFEDATVAPSLMGSGLCKRGKPTLYTATTVPPRCQVEGCHVPLLHAKDYHRRHRVCEMHSKAPKVVLLGLHQRFCQQCSRFHVISEFDDSKRSCRRRLAGHNERRRKTSHESAVAARNNNVCSQSQETKSMRGRIAAYIPASPTGRALSLLSSKKESWATSSELSLRSSAALRELIAENRAAILARQLIPDRGDCWQPNHTPAPDDFGGAGFPHQQGLYYEQQQQQQQLQQHGWERLHDENGGAHVTLELMQAPNTAFGLLSVRGKSKEEEDEQECCQLWNSFHDHHSHVL